MTRTSPALLSLILAVAAGAARAQSAGGVPLETGDAVEYDLSRLPKRFEGGARAICKGTVITAVGPTETTCERSVRFEVPAEGARLACVFRAASGAETRVELPVTSADRPVRFRAPAKGTLQPPAPVTIPAEAADRAARAAAEGACRACRGGQFRLESVVVTDPPAPRDGDATIRLKITKGAPASAPAR